MLHGVEAGPESFTQALAALLWRCPATADRVAAVEAALKSSAGPLWREQLGQWTTSLVPVEELVPDAYRHWRPLVRDAMQFVVTHLAPDRLAPKVIEQFELDPEMPAELRLLRIIAKVPGLQKIGQVLARNRHFQPRFRRALIELENGISDVDIGAIRSIIQAELGERIGMYRIKLSSSILSEASVSAVVRFTWHNPATRRREPGVFKVLKPHIASCFAEDMMILERLAGFLARRYRQHRTRFSGLAETLIEIRLLLQHEVDFRREQATLAKALGAYRSLPGVRVPRLIPELSTNIITALSHENGVKVTTACRRPAMPRARLAERLAQTLVAVPLLSLQEEAIFHADPHAGNLLYDQRRGELVILDWALAEPLTRHQRRQVLMLALMVTLRDEDGMRQAIDRLRQHRAADDEAQSDLIRERVRSFLAALPLFRLPGPLDAMRLLDDAARAGVRFPASLLMLRKAWFTLDGVIEDVAGTPARLNALIAGYALRHWAATGAAVWSLLSMRDWMALEWSTLTFATRVWAQQVFPGGAGGAGDRFLSPA